MWEGTKAPGYEATCRHRHFPRFLEGKSNCRVESRHAGPINRRAIEATVTERGVVWVWKRDARSDVRLRRQKCTAIIRRGIAQVSALGISEASALLRFKCISIMGDSNGGSATVRSRGGVLSREGPFSEVPLYSFSHLLLNFSLSQVVSSYTYIIPSGNPSLIDLAMMTNPEDLLQCTTIPQTL